MEFLGAQYVGQTTVDGHRAHGFGEYSFPNGDKYIGSFLDGVFHGIGVIFFAAGYQKDTSLKNFLGRGDEKSNYEAQYRGTWEFGRNTSGSYVFPDGLVITQKEDFELSCKEWPYCHNGDHRLWNEHLKKISPVLPCDSLAGGATVQRKLEKVNNVWEKAVIWAPSTLAEDLIAPAFAENQPRSSSAVPDKWWDEDEAREKIAHLFSLPTPSLDVTYGDYKGKDEANLFPLELLPNSFETGSRQLKIKDHWETESKEITNSVAVEEVQEKRIEGGRPISAQSIHGQLASPVAQGATSAASPIVGEMPESYIDKRWSTSIQSVHGHLASSPTHGAPSNRPSVAVGEAPVYNIEGVRYSVSSVNASLNKSSSVLNNSSSHD